MKATLEFDLPESCSCCPIAFLYTDVNGDDCIGCGYLNTDVTEHTENRHRDCPLKTM